MTASGNIALHHAIARLAADPSVRARAAAGDLPVEPSGLSGEETAKLGALARLWDSSLLAGLPEEEMALLLERSHVQRFHNSDVIVQEGEIGDEFHIIVAGAASVSMRTRAGGAMDVASLGPGDFFGELALLYNIPRTATVLARETVDAWSLKRDDFRELVSVAPVIGRRITEVAVRRLNG